jgi:hypothetical protein
MGIDSAVCVGCGADLGAVPTGACPRCGDVRRKIRVFVTDTVTVTDSVNVEVLVREALAELSALPTDTRNRVVHGFARFAVVATSGTIVAAGFAPRDAPRLHQLWRALPAAARTTLLFAVATASAVGTGAANKAGEDLYEALKNGIRAIATAEREPTPAPPLPPLVRPGDAVQEDDDADVCVNGADGSSRR